MNASQKPVGIIGSIYRPGLTRELLIGGVGSIGIKAVQVLLTVALSAILARTLGPSGYGIYAYILTLVLILIIPGQCGLPKLITREIASGQALENLDLVRGILRWSLIVGLFGTATVAFLALAIVLSLRSRISAEVFSTCLLGVSLLPLMTLVRLFGGALRGLRGVVASQLPDIVFRPGMFLLLVVVIAFGFGERLSPSHAMGLHVVAAGISLVGAGLLFYRYCPRGIFSSGNGIYRNRAWFGGAVAFIMISGTYQINQYADIMLLGIFVPKDQIGLYKVAVQAGLLGIIGLQAAQILTQPYIARFYAQGDMRKLRRVLRAASRWAFLLSSIIFIIVAVAGRRIITLVFGHAYVASYAPLLILISGQLVNSFFGVVNILLEMTGNQKKSALAFAIGAVSNVLLNLILIPLFGIIGSAAATAMSTVIWNLLLWRFAHTRLGLNSTALARHA